MRLPRSIAGRSKTARRSNLRIKERFLVLDLKVVRLIWLDVMKLAQKQTNVCCRSIHLVKRINFHDDATVMVHIHQSV